MNITIQARRQGISSKNQPVRFNIWNYVLGGGQWA